MAKQVKDLMLSLSEYAVVDEDATILDALKALKESQVFVLADRQPHRAVLVQNLQGVIVGKLHHFAFLRALIPERKSMIEREFLSRAGVDDNLLESSMHTLDLFTADFVDVCVRARNVAVRDVYTPTTVGIAEEATLADAIGAFLAHQTLSLLVQRDRQTVGILRLSDLFDELAKQIVQNDCSGNAQ
jgi:predicted transcriptional regulator